MCRFRLRNYENNLRLLEYLASFINGRGVAACHQHRCVPSSPRCVSLSLILPKALSFARWHMSRMSAARPLTEWWSCVQPHQSLSPPSLSLSPCQSGTSGNFCGGQLHCRILQTVCDCVEGAFSVAEQHPHGHHGCLEAEREPRRRLSFQISATRDRSETLETSEAERRSSQKRDQEGRRPIREPRRCFASYEAQRRGAFVPPGRWQRPDAARAEADLDPGKEGCLVRGGGLQQKRTQGREEEEAQISG